MSNNTEVEKKKRGRKKQIPNEHVTTGPTFFSSESGNSISNTLQVHIQDSTPNTAENTPKKVGRKSKNKENEPEVSTQIEDNDSDNENVILSPIASEEKVIKKRGRKPKGGKITTQQLTDFDNKDEIPNIILHLKCSINDLQKNSLLHNEHDNSCGGIESYNSTSIKGADIHNNQYNLLAIKNNQNENLNSINNYKVYNPNIQESFNKQNNTSNNNNNIDYDDSEDQDNFKDIWKKINQLKLSFHKSDTCQNIGANQRSACFWCTFDFDSPPIYIPKTIIKDVYQVYGCFCSPECSAAFLMNENIDTSTKFERYHLLNSLYGKIYKYEKSIKMAPNPYYLLNKYYGNLSINEYRKLFKSDQMIYVVNKPLTHILPELYEDNNDFLLNNKIIPNNNISVKKNKQLKNNIISEAFGLNSNNN